MESSISALATASRDWISPFLLIYSNTSERS
jgi:hypothetical protein